MLQAGQRNHRIRFERRQDRNPDAPDDFGNANGAWLTVATVWAAIRADTRGRENVVTGVLTSGFSGIATVLRSTLTRDLTADDRIVVVGGPHKGQVWQIRAVMPRSDSSEIDLQFESGAAT